MRLLKYTPDGSPGLTENLISDDVPPYAILSHTWQDGHEVTFDDLLAGNGKDKAGYKKILFCARQAQRDGLDYCWVATCCIDKSSSAELSEALNSMFRWQSRWFTRGWTLQELITPKLVGFFSKEEELLASKDILDLLLHEITGIPVKRFSWAAKHHTLRAEDESYCLIGIFGIYLPVIYGEGRLSAMKRLLNEVEGPPM
ncbi:hypothetical protein BU23DRAFT_585460 [Bimuria novae-zelandiae CBS 107.79]|uniref:Heterokaryon incompatibility domain-containing protein n=1 Tax=Bimuria novae-zelandiae CBS 107.79 TaxID=1447943 RepID=A0A6A5UHJ5_9PLEO|nr:hypothetical protein BU23DRAFT_585460 [Bimuria novae-zelandiae CBS 107.79]